MEDENGVISEPAKSFLKSRFWSAPVCASKSSSILPMRVLTSGKRFGIEPLSAAHYGLMVGRSNEPSLSAQARHLVFSNHQGVDPRCCRTIGRS